MYNKKMVDERTKQAFFRRSEARVKGLLASWPELDLQPSRKKGVQLSAYLGAAAPEQARALSSWLGQRGNATSERGYLNVNFALELLWQWLLTLGAEEDLPRDWAARSEVPDFAPIFYARNRLRMELFALEQGNEERMIDHVVTMPSGSMVEKWLWPLFALGFWPEGQRQRVLSKWAEGLAMDLEGGTGRDRALIPLWQGWACLLEEDDASCELDGESFDEVARDGADVNGMDVSQR